MNHLADELDAIHHAARTAVSGAADLAALDEVRLAFLGRTNGRLTKILQSLPSLSPEDKKIVGRRGNEVKRALEDALAARKRALEDAALETSLQTSLDLTLPGAPLRRGNRHPVNQVMEEIVAVFTSIGFNRAEGPEVETDDNNFTALNHPPDHPARDAHDTFYLKDHRDSTGRPLLLRTHTSPVQIRHMRGRTPPIYVVAPGRVFRHEAVDATHSFVFHQVEGLAVDTDISLADLKGALTLFARRLFSTSAQVRFRPSYFPFVEPGLEVDISCTLCAGAGCRVCKNTGWVEMLGAGLVHPNVLRGVGIDPETHSGYAFGIGVERVAMFKYGVDDIRLFLENDVAFLEAFA
jgi:phenylalanyl-tRNA synthetase alpha chain